VTLVNCSITDVNVLKTNITAFYALGLEGVVLIGELPYAMAVYHDNAWGVDRYFPTDLFLMDLDGQWLDVLPPIGIFNIDHTNGQIEHTNGSGDWEAEIWLGRISPYSMGMPGINYTQELIDYFDRNHDYRTGVLSRPHNACLYIDDDWSSYKAEWESNLTAYTGSSIDVYATDALTNSTDYINQLNKTDYEFVHLLVHSWQTNHTFGLNGDGSDGVLRYKDVWGNDTRPLFYNLYACFSCDFTVKNNTGTYYLFSNDTLCVIGSARSGGMDLYQCFYDNLTQNATIGEAFKNWWYNPEIESLNPPVGKTELYYGMTIFGDPLLTILMNDGVSDSITVTKPDATTTWYNNTQYSINWTSTGTIIEVNISLYNSSGWVQNIVLETPNNGSCNWTVPNSLDNGTDYHINITDASTNFTSGVSADFEIRNDLADPDSLTVTNPITSSIWNVNSQYSINWTSTGTIINVNISLYNGSGWVQNIVLGTLNNGSYNWTVPNSLYNGTDYYVNITDASTNDTSDISDNFEINNTIPVPDSLTVTNPTSSSTWYKTEQYEIKWTWTGSFGPIQIFLHNASGQVLLLTSAGGTPNDGSFLWTVPSNLSDGSEYYFRVEDMSGTPSDTSDNFTIAVKPTIPTTDPPPGGGGGIPGADIFFIGIICSILTITVVNKRRKRILI